MLLTLAYSKPQVKGKIQAVLVPCHYSDRETVNTIISHNIPWTLFLKGRMQENNLPLKMLVNTVFPHGKPAIWESKILRQFC